MKNAILNLMAWKESEEGQSMVEYGLILALVVVVVISVITAMGTNLNTILGNVRDNL